MRLLTRWENYVLRECFHNRGSGCIFNIFGWVDEITILLEKGMIRTYEQGNPSPKRRFFITELGAVFAENPELPLI